MENDKNQKKPGTLPGCPYLFPWFFRGIRVQLSKMSWAFPGILP